MSRSTSSSTRFRGPRLQRTSSSTRRPLARHRRHAGASPRRASSLLYVAPAGPRHAGERRRRGAPTCSNRIDIAAVGMVVIGARSEGVAVTTSAAGVPAPRGTSEPPPRPRSGPRRAHRCRQWRVSTNTPVGQDPTPRASSRRRADAAASSPPLDGVCASARAAASHRAPLPASHDEGRATPFLGRARGTVRAVRGDRLDGARNCPGPPTPIGCRSPSAMPPDLRAEALVVVGLVAGAPSLQESPAGRSPGCSRRRSPTGERHPRRGRRALPGAHRRGAGASTTPITTTARRARVQPRRARVRERGSHR